MALREVGTLKEVGTLEEVGSGLEVIGVLPSAGPEASGPEVIGTLPERDYLGEARRAVEQAEALMKYHPSELPPEYSAPTNLLGTLFGIYQDPKVLQEAELRRRKVGKYLTESPKALAAIEGLGGALPQSLIEEHKAPTVEEVHDREKTLAESAIELGTGLAAEIPLFMAAGTVGGLVVPTYTGKKLAVKMLQQAVRHGTSGAVFHATKNFADQMFSDPFFDPTELGKEAATGFALWGALGAIGPAAGRAFGRGWEVMSPRLKGFTKLKLRANNSGLTTTIERVEGFGNKRMVRIEGPEGLKLEFGDVATANKFLENAELEGVGKLMHDRSIIDALTAIRRAHIRLESSMFQEPRDVGRLESIYQKVWGNIVYFSRRMEESSMGKAVVKDLRKKAFSLGLSGESAKRWVGMQMAARSKAGRLYTDIVEPILEANRIAENGTTKFSRYIQRAINEQIDKIAATKGETPTQVAYQITEWLDAIGPREAISPKTVINNINAWRQYTDKGPAYFQEAYSRINRFVRANNMPESSVPKLLKLTIFGKGTLTQAEVKRTLGSAIKKASPGARVKAGVATKMKRPQEWEVPYSETQQTTEFVERIHKMTPEQIEVAKKARKVLDHLFRVGDVDRDAYMRFYVPARRAAGVLEWTQAQQLWQKEFPKHAWAKAKFFAQMHKEGAKFMPEKDIRRLLSQYTHGAFRAQHLNDLLNEAQNRVSAIKSIPVKARMQRFLDDMITGIDSRTRLAINGAMEEVTGGVLPKEVVNDFVDTAISATYGSTMGFRPWLLMRNALQTSQTTLPLVGESAFTKAWLDLASFRIIKDKSGRIISLGKLFDDFIAQGVHIRKGAGLPFGEEISRGLTAAGRDMPKIGAGWTGVRQVLAVLRQASNFSTKGYQMVDTLNRFVSYRAGLHRIEEGLARKGVVDNLASKAMKIARRLPLTRVPGDVTGADLVRSRWDAITELTNSKQMNSLIAATGLRSWFEDSTVERLFKRRLAEVLFTGSTKKGKIFQDLYLLKSEKKVATLIREAFLGHKGTLQEELAKVMGQPGLVETTMETARDTLGKHASRLLVADTQWLYNKVVQSPVMQSKLFGMFGTWHANIIDYVRRHSTSIGTRGERAKKMLRFATVLGTTYKALHLMGISGAYLFSSLGPFAGGPYAQPFMDVLTQGRFVSEGEKKLARERLKKLHKDIPKLLAPGYSQARSLYQTAKGEKPLIPGILGATPTKRSLYQGADKPIATKPLTSYDMLKLEGYIRMLETGDDTEKRIAYTMLEQDVQRLTGDTQGDPIKTAIMLLESKPKAVKEGELL